MSGHAYHFIRRADLIFGIGTSFTKHGMVMNIPSGKTLIQATNDASDINKDYNIDLPIVGDIRGKGLMIGLEFVADKEQRTPFDPKQGVTSRIVDVAFEILGKLWNMA
mgnify:CR=1 FL=1